MNLHDWIDELCDALDIDAEVDEALVLDLARSAAHNVTRPAAPISAYLLGYAAGLSKADPDEVEHEPHPEQRLPVAAPVLRESADRLLAPLQRHRVDRRHDAAVAHPADAEPHIAQLHERPGVLGEG